MPKIGPILIYHFAKPIKTFKERMSDSPATDVIKIEQQKLVVSKAKDKYEAELEQLNQLIKKRDELHNKELLQAIEQSNRSFEEIMDFLSTDDSQE